jgi:preprotein translocase subunit YajC
MIPHTDWERLELLKEIECGDKVVIPVSLEHAKFMIKVAQDYIAKNKQEMWNSLKGNQNVKTY